MDYPSSIIGLVKEFGINADKKYGQCFLTDNNVLDKIVELSAISREDLVVEIGAGPANLTARLSAAAGLVIAFETDRNLVKIYERYFNDSNVSFFIQDFLKADLSAIIKKVSAGKNAAYKAIKVVANIPYYITSQIIENLLYSNVSYEDIVLLMQADVADRIVSAPGTKDYGILSVACNLKADVKCLKKIPNTCFSPRPEIDSALVRFTPRKRELGDNFNEDVFFAIVKSAFNQRRKIAVSAIANNISRICEINRYAEAITGFFKSEDIKRIAAGIFKKTGLLANARAEQISLNEYIALANEFNLLIGSGHGGLN